MIDPNAQTPNLSGAAVDPRQLKALEIAARCRYVDLVPPPPPEPEKEETWRDRPPLL